jgi:hypothetical protein
MTIEELNLTPVAENAARLLHEKYPHLEFTSGRRNVPQQAHAMAYNIVKTGNRQWIAGTYKAAAKLQQWVDAHPNAKTIDEIAAGLQATMETMPEVELLKVSKHLTGKAFDIRQVAANAEPIKTFIRTLPGLSTFLDKEGGATRWHAQF